MHRVLGGRLAATSLLLLTLVVAACSGSSPGTAAPASAAASAAASAPASAPASAAASSGTGGAAAGSVAIQGFAFGPASITVKVGDTVTWTNGDTASHTVTADDGSFDSTSLASGATFSQTFAKAGTYAYHCSIHTNMKATVIVQ